MGERRALTHKQPDASRSGKSISMRTRAELTTTTKKRGRRPGKSLQSSRMRMVRRARMRTERRALSRKQPDASRSGRSITIKPPEGLFILTWRRGRQKWRSLQRYFSSQMRMQRRVKARRNRAEKEKRKSQTPRAPGNFTMKNLRTKRQRSTSMRRFPRRIRSRVKRLRGSFFLENGALRDTRGKNPEIGSWIGPKNVTTKKSDYPF